MKEQGLLLDQEDLQQKLISAHKTVIEKGSLKGWDHLWLHGVCHLQTQLV